MNTPRSDSTQFPQAHEVVQFWRQAGPSKWFSKDQAFDHEFRRRFSDLHFSAARREFDAWCTEPESNLALLILLDQFPRNAFRGSGHMYATDSLARYYARKLLDAGFIHQLESPLRVFAFLPLTHSEDPADQELSAQLYQEHAADSAKWGGHHRDIIKKFGRFPHRNKILGRATTDEEQAYLDEGGFEG